MKKHLKKVKHFLLKRERLFFITMVFVGLFVGTFVFISLPFLSPSEKQKINTLPLVFGSESAPIQIKTYTSLSCPHDLYFLKNVLPQLLENEIQAGKTTYRLMPFSYSFTDTAAFLLLSCVDQPQQKTFFFI